MQCAASEIAEPSTSQRWREALQEYRRPFRAPSSAYCEYLAHFCVLDDDDDRHACLSCPVDCDFLCYVMDSCATVESPPFYRL